MSKDAKRALKKEKIRICCREYFSSDQIILIDSSMLRVRTLSYLLQNNTYFGNKILFSKNDVDKYVEFTEEVNGELVTKNAKEIIRLVNNYPLEYQVVEMGEGKNDILEFLMQNKDVILYTTEENLKEQVEKYKLRCRVYKKHANIDKDFPKSVRYVSLEQIQNRGKCNFIKPSDEIKVYDSNKQELIYKEVKLTENDIILVIKRMEDITRYIIYRVVNYHSKRNLIQIAWSDVKKGTQEIKWIPDEFVEIVRQNL